MECHWMVLAELFSGPQLMTLGLIVLATAVLLRRGFTAGRRGRNRDVLAEVRRELCDAEQGTSQLHKMELRLHDYGRDVEGRVQTTLAVLDELVLEADREIERLQALLAEQKRDSSRPATVRRPDLIQPAGQAANGAKRDCDAETDVSRRPLVGDDRLMIVYLGQAGFHAEEIARCMNRDIDEVQEILAAAEDFGRADAA